MCYQLCSNSLDSFLDQKKRKLNKHLGFVDSQFCHCLSISLPETKKCVGRVVKKNRTNSQGHPPPLHLTHLLCPTLHARTHTHTHTVTNHACIKAYWDDGKLRPHCNSVSTQTSVTPTHTCTLYYAQMP